MIAKDTKNKLDLTTVPISLIEEVAKVREFGIKKYKERDNWREVPADKYEQALYRHWLAYLKGEDKDNESGLSHLSHIACNLAFLIELKQ